MSIPEPWRPKRSGRGWLLAVPLVAAVVGGAVGYWGYAHNQRQELLSGISEAINAFAEASDTADAKTMASLLCRAEAAQFVDGFEGQEDEGPIEPAERRPVDIGPITVTGDDATVDVTRPPAPAVTFKLKREDGAWKLCNPG